MAEPARQRAKKKKKTHKTIECLVGFHIDCPIKEGPVKCNCTCHEKKR